MSLDQITPRGAARAYSIARDRLDNATLLRLAHELANCLSADEKDQFFGLIAETDRDGTGDDFVSNKASASRPFSGAEDAACPWDRIRHEGSPIRPKRPGRDYELFLRRNPHVARIKLEN